MWTMCAHCGQPDVDAAKPGDKAPRAGDMYQCPACGKLSVSTGDGLRRPTAAELADATRDWRQPRNVIPAMIGFDRRG